ncbi:MAG: M1 family metallopeptidase [Planctomycetes bacterium]|nr:M1 family metallopeptidase [Planctomycetota bacterium]
MPGFSRTLLALAAVGFALFGAGCRSAGVASGKESQLRADQADRDGHSRSRPWEIRSTHLELELELDFEARKLRGRVIHHLRREPGCPKDAAFACDLRALEIRGAWAGREGDLRAATQRIVPGTDFGDGLEVALEPGDDRVAIDFETTAAGTGLQWLEPAQTAGRKAPFLFSQSQAIHARTWFPCQDSPGVRASYEARVRCPEGLEVVMSAEKLPAADGWQRFRLERPIPSYLIAIAAGRLASAEIGPRSRVWAEPEQLDLAASEFVDTEKMIQTIEGLYGPYRWGRYDILVLPPSFPFGGMENPLLTFATPTILAGDRSLVALIAHELAHSWSGNLVTNATWRDFWLNEGFTVYVEQRVMEALFGPERAGMEIMLAMRSLKEEMAELEPRDQILHVDLDGRDPDAGFTGVPYDKGAAFLRRLEQAVGRERFDRFLRGWFDGHAFRSVSTADFVEYLERELPEAADAVDLALWIEGPGLPEDAPIPVSRAFETIDRKAADFVAGSIEAGAIAAGAWTTQEWLRFISSLGDRLPRERMVALDRAFGLNARRNSEISCAWLELAVRSHYEAAWPRLEEFLCEQGRRKFLKPLYKALAEDPELIALGRRIYARARPGYHAISTGTIDEIIGRP